MVETETGVRLGAPADCVRPQHHALIVAPVYTSGATSHIGPGMGELCDFYITRHRPPPVQHGAR